MTPRRRDAEAVAACMEQDGDWRSVAWKRTHWACVCSTQFPGYYEALTDAAIHLLRSRRDRVIRAARKIQGDARYTFYGKLTLDQVLRDYDARRKARARRK